MGFFILPLLLLGLLSASLFGGDGNDDDNGGNDGGNDNTGDDTLNGADTDTVYGGAGNDDLTLIDAATGLGGTGNDTIEASDDATGYGRDGDDSLTGHDNATVMGGNGDDQIEVNDSAYGNGGAGADRISLTIDTLATVSETPDAPSADGGGGADTLLASSGLDGGSVTVGGGAGGDAFVITDVNSKFGADDAGLNTSMTITDFDPATDTIGIIANPDRLDELDVITNYDAASDTTTVRVMDWNPYNSVVAEFLLKGEQSFDASNLKVYNFDAQGNLIPLDVDLTVQS